MTKLTLIIKNSTGEEGHGEGELPVDIPAEHLHNVAQSIVAGMIAAWEQQEQMLQQSEESPTPARKKSAMKR